MVKRELSQKNNFQQVLLKTKKNYDNNEVENHSRRYFSGKILKLKGEVKIDQGLMQTSTQKQNLFGDSGKFLGAEFYNEIINDKKTNHICSLQPNGEQKNYSLGELGETEIPVISETRCELLDERKLQASETLIELDYGTL